MNRVVEPEQLLVQALQMAREMLSAMPEMLVAYKRLIDDGLEGSLAAGLKLERERSAEWARAVKGADIAQRREDVRARGRTQQRNLES